MKINAIMIIKNEVDMVEETLLHAMKFCHKIYIYDNKSTDGTWELVNSMADRFSQIVIFGQTDDAYRNQFRNRVYNEIRHLYCEKDWWYILDADELLVESPYKALVCAAGAGKTAMKVWQAQFYFTDTDYEKYELEDKSLPISQRRLHYEINWKEERFFINRPERDWPENLSGRLPPWANNVAAQVPICRHYAQRTPEQMEDRIVLRKNTQFGFAHVKRCPRVVFPDAKKLNKYDPKNGVLTFRQTATIKYYLKTLYFWVSWRKKALVERLLAVPKPSLIASKSRKEEVKC